MLVKRFLFYLLCVYEIQIDRLYPMCFFLSLSLPVSSEKLRSKSYGRVAQTHGFCYFLVVVVVAGFFSFYSCSFEMGISRQCLAINSTCWGNWLWTCKMWMSTFHKILKRSCIVRLPWNNERNFYFFMKQQEKKTKLQSNIIFFFLAEK